MAYFLIVLLAIFVAFMIARPDERRLMIWAGIFSLPVLLIKPLISKDFYNIAVQNGGIVFFLMIRAATGFLFGAVSSAIYEVVFHKKITPVRHPHRSKFIWLLTGLVLFFLLFFAFNLSFFISIVLALFVDLAITFFIRKDLVWDGMFSGFSMGVLYLVIFLFIYRGIPSDVTHFWFAQELTGINIFSVPIEELISAFLFGAVWGPLYIVVKDMKISNV